jgi:hypothetical protein
VTVKSDTKVVAVSPAHAAATTNVRVTTPAGQSAVATPADQFTFGAAPVVTAVSPVSGPVAGGTSVTVTGSGFTGATAVTFGGVAATGVTVNSDTSVTAVSPAHAAATTNARVTTPIGLSAVVTPADQFTFSAAPVLPVVTGVSPASGPVAGGTSVTITGTGFIGATGVSFGGVAASGVTVNSDTSVTAVSPAHAAATTNVRVTTPVGQSAVVTPADQFTFRALVIPAVTGLAPSTGSIKGGTTVVITGSGFTGTTGVAFGAGSGGGQASSMTVSSDTQITATSPAHAAGTVNVFVTNPAGTSATVTADRFTYATATISPVTGVTVTDTTDTSVTLSWTNPTFSGFAGVTIRRAAGTIPPSSPTGGAAVADVNATTTTYTDSGLTPGATYSYALFAHNASSQYAKAATASASALPVPQVQSVAPVGLGIQLDWTPTPVADTALVGSYQVVVSPTSDDPAPCVSVTDTASASDSSLVVEGLCAGSVYTASVATVDGSTVGLASTSNPVVPLTAQVPSSPLINEVVGRNGSLVATWSPPVLTGGMPITGYTLTAKNGTTVIATKNVSASTTSATLTGLADGTEYTVTLKASNSVGASTADDADGTPQAAYAPDAPGGFTALAGTAAGSIDLSWRAPDDDGGDAVTGYMISYLQVVPDDADGWQAADDATATTVNAPAGATTYEVDGITPVDTYYQFTIAATNAAGTGTTATASPVAPTTSAASSTVVLSAATMSALTSDTNGALTWPAPAPAQVSSLATGDTIVAAPAGAAPDGLLDVIDSITTTSGTYTVTVSPGSLSDAFNALSLSSTTDPLQDADSPDFRDANAWFVQPLEGGAGGHFVPTAAGVEVLPGTASPHDTVTFSRDITLGLDLQQAGGADASVSGELSFTPSLSLGASVNHGFADVPDGANLTASASLTAAASIAAGIDGTYHHKIGEIVGDPIDVQAGPVPIVVVPKIPVFLTISGKLGVHASVSLSVGATLAWSSRHPSDLDVTNNSKGLHLTGGGAIPGLTITGEASIELEEQPQLDIYDVAGPYLDATEDLTATLDTSASPYLTIGPSLTLKAGFDVDVLGYDKSLDVTIGTFTYPAFTITSAPTASYTVSPADPTVSQGNPVTFTATRSSGTGGTLTWSLIGATPADTITSGGKLSVGGHPGRTLQVLVSDKSGAEGTTTVTVGSPYDPPGSPSASWNPDGKSATLTWTPPTHTGGSAITSYVISTQPATSTVTAAGSATSAQLTGLDNTRQYVITITARNTVGLQSAAATTSLAATEQGATPTDWIPTELPVPANGLPGTAYAGDVSCGGEGTCAADGSYMDATGKQDELIETLTDGTWTAVEAPIPAGGQPGTAQLGGLSCGGEGTCAAVGSYMDPGGAPNTHWLIETFSGGSWTAVEAPIPVGGQPGTAELDGVVSCGGEGTCAAIGAYSGSDDELDDELIETLSGGSWTAVEAPVPAGGGPDTVMLDDVSCGDDGTCAAIGATDATGNQDGLIETLSGGTWTAVEVPVPAGSEPGSFALLDVSCGGERTCAVAGSYWDASDGSYGGLIETLAGGTWTAIEAPVPAGGEPGTAGLGGGVSCGDDGTCAVVGSYIDSLDGGFDGLIETLSGGTWTATEAPVPAGGQPGTVVLDDGVSCGGEGTCSAVGPYTDASDGSYGGLIETLSGGTWTAVEAPVPAGGKSDTFDIEYYEYWAPPAGDDVSCGGDGTCAATGEYTSSDGSFDGLIETLSGDTWTAVQTPVPAGGQSGTAGLGGGVSCGDDGTCSATGIYYLDNDGDTHGLIETLTP